MLPSAAPVPALRQTTDAFPGLDCRPRPVAGACAALKNLVGGEYPVLSSRPGRGTVATLRDPGGLLAKDALCYVDGGSLYVNGYAVDLGLTSGAKQLLSMGAYAIVFPDKKYVNTADLSDFGPLEASVTTASAVTFALSDRFGSALSYVSAEPADPAEGDLWLDASGPALRRWTDSGWTEEPDVHVRVGCAGIGAPFSAGDGVTFRDAGDLNGLHVVTEAGADYLLVPGVTEAQRQTAALTVAREVPDLDFVCECGNRLWGCRYGISDGTPVNELYACKLGDFRNWHCFQGLATDAWRASRGADGPFTGACAFQGSPIFFRETCLERVYPDAAGAHQVAVTQAPGVRSGCAASLASANGSLYYLAPGGVAAYDGALPRFVSKRLGTCHFSSGIGAVLGSEYYLSVLDGTARRLLVYDTERGDWYEQDDPGLTALCTCGWELYGLCADGRLLSMTGAEGEPEGPVSWSLETGDLGLDSPVNKQIARLRLRLLLGGSLTAAVRYDSRGDWVPAGRVESLGLRSMTLPILPRRCDHLRLRLTGTGSFRLYSLSRLLTEGSDEP